MKGSVELGKLRSPFQQISSTDETVLSYLVVVPTLISAPSSEAGTSILDSVIFDVFLTAAVIVTALCLHTGNDVSTR